jgi:hypothetical protein
MKDASHKRSHGRKSFVIPNRYKIPFGDNENALSQKRYYIKTDYKKRKK